MPNVTVIPPATITVKVGQTNQPKVNELAYGQRTLKSATDLDLSGAGNNYVLSYNTVSQIFTTVDPGTFGGQTLAQAAYNQANAAIVQAQSASNTANAASANNVYLQNVNDTQNTWISSNATFTQSAYNQANSSNVLAQAAYDWGNTINVFTQSSYAQANSAVANTIITQGVDSTQNTWIASNSTFAQAAFNTANNANLTSNLANNTSNVAAANITVLFGINTTQNTWIASNATFTQSAYNQANSSNVLAQAAFNTANTANLTANLANNTANIAAANITVLFGIETTQNTWIASNSTFAQAAFNTANTANLTANLANNTANVAAANISVLFGIETTQNTWIASNAVFTQSAFNLANSTNILAQSGYNWANTINVFVQSSYAQANSAVANTIITQGVDATQNTWIASNAVFAQAAFNTANTKINSSGGTISGSLSITNDLTVSGNLIVSGNSTTINTTSLVVNDTLIYLGNNNFISDTVDIGFIGHYNATGNAHTGLFRDPNLKEYLFFQGYVPEVQSNNLINIADPSFAYANVYSSYFKGNLIGNTVVVNGTDMFSFTNNAYGVANSASANTVSLQGGLNTANANISVLFGIETTQNTWIASNAVFTQSAYTWANTINIFAQSAYAQANSAVANTVITQGVDTTQNTWISANAAYTQAAFNVANNASANTIITQGVDATQNTLISNIQAVDLTQNANITIIQGVDTTQNSWISSNAAFTQAAFNIANTVYFGYAANTLVVANSTGYLSNSNVYFVSANTTLITPTLNAGLTPTTVNYHTFTGSNTANAVVYGSAGSDANVSIAVIPKGTGAIDLAPGANGINISNGGTVTAVTRTNGGTNYTGVVSATVSAPTTTGGTTATIQAYTGAITNAIQSGGTGYTLNDTLTLVGGTGIQSQTLTVSAVSSGVITAVTVGNYGYYTVLPTNPVSVTGGTGSGATFNLSNFSFTYAAITNAGSGYVEQPTITFSGSGGSGAAAYAFVGSAANIKGIGGSPNNNALLFYTPGGPVFGIADRGATTVNYVQATGGQTNVGPIVSSAGSDSNIDLTIKSTGTSGKISFATSTNSNFQAIITNTTSAVNYLSFTGGATGKNAFLSVAGSDANVPLAIQTKGTGAIDLAAGANGINISNGTTVTAISRTAAGSGYTTPPTWTASASQTTGGTTATGNVSNIGVVTATISGNGSGYLVGDVLTVVGGTFTTAATLTVATLSSGNIATVTISNAGAYTASPTNPASVTGGTGTSATFTLSFGINNAFTITQAGTGYVEQPTITFSGGGGSAAAAYASVGSLPINIKALNGQFSFLTPAGESFRIFNNSAYAATLTDFVEVRGSVGGAYVSASGSAAFSNLYVSSKGAGFIGFYTNGAGITSQFQVAHTASAVNYVTATGGATTASPSISVAGSDANINLTLTPKGTGAVRTSAALYAGLITGGTF